MSQPNPFADEPLPVGKRLHSAADPLNPYAAPAGVAEYQVQTDGPGVGVWRNGDLIVIHQSLNLPDRCIWTNEPTLRRFTNWLTYSTWLGLRNWKIGFDYGFSRTALRKVMKVAIIGLLIFVGSVGAIAGLIALESYNLLHLTWLAPFFMILAAVGCLLAVQQAQHPLTLIHQENGYFCLRGAKEPFLKSLPNWPGLQGQSKSG